MLATMSRSSHRGQRQEGRTGRTRMQWLKEFFKNDRFAAHSGIELVEAGDGKAKAVMQVTEDHLNGVGTVQGGAIFTLADLAFAAAANSHGAVAVAISANISFFKGISSGTLVAEAEEDSLHPKLGSYTIRVRDGDGDLVALFQGMVYRKRDKIGPESDG